MSDLRKYSRKSAPELRRIIGEREDELSLVSSANTQLRKDIEKLRAELKELKGLKVSLSDEIEYSRKWVCPDCNYANEQYVEWGVDPSPQEGDTLTCDSCGAEVEAVE